MCKKALGLFLLGTLFFFCSCVDDTYDLNKEITTDVELKGNKLSLPLGSLKPFELGTWFNGLDIIETLEDGVYAFVQSDTIAPVEKAPHEILIDIPPQHIVAKQDVSEYMPNIPDIPDMPNIPNMPNIPGLDEALKNIENPINIPFDESNEFSFASPISIQYMYIESVALKEDLTINLGIKIDGLEALIESDVIMNLSITLPPFLDEVYSTDPTISTEKNKVTLKQKKYYVDSKEGLSIELICKGLNFKDEDGSGLHPENGVLAYDGKIKAEGNIDIQWTKSDLLNNIKNLKEIGINLDCTFNPVHVQTLNGTFYEKFDTLRQTFTVDMGEQLNSLKESENYITLSDPQISVALNNAISMPINVSLDVLGKDLYGNVIESEDIHTQIPIKAAQYDDLTGLVIPDTSKLFVTDEVVEVAEDYTNIVIPNLGRLLESIPDSISVSIHPDIDTSVPHHIDIYQVLNISASYGIMIPFKFDKLHITYTDTIQVGLGETLKDLGEEGIKLKMNIENTIPVDLTLKLTALDENNVPVDAINIAPIKIKQGNGEGITTSRPEKSPVSFNLQNEDGSLARLNKLKVEAEIQSNDATMGLKGIQGIRISDIVVELSADIITEGNEKNEDEK